jgi:N-methylhydantoinase A/oxoprolinase/acetone carboxylase beta subunit
VLDWRQLEAGNIVHGPAIIQRMGDSVVIPPGYRAEVDRRATLRLRGGAGAASDARTSSTASASS